MRIRFKSNVLVRLIGTRGIKLDFYRIASLVFLKRRTVVDDLQFTLRGRDLNIKVALYYADSLCWKTDYCDALFIFSCRTVFYQKSRTDVLRSPLSSNTGAHGRSKPFVSVSAEPIGIGYFQRFKGGWRSKKMVRNKLNIFSFFSKFHEI